MTQSEPAIALVAAWHDALNSADPDRFAATIHPDVELVGPRGSGFGRALVRDWATHAAITLDPDRWFALGDMVVVAQTARWRDSDTGIPGLPQPVATLFRLHDGLIVHIARHPDLRTALTAADLTLSDELTDLSIPRQTPETDPTP